MRIERIGVVGRCVCGWEQVFWFRWIGEGRDTPSIEYCNSCKMRVWMHFLRAQVIPEGSLAVAGEEETGKPEYIGKFPMRQDIVVLPAFEEGCLFPWEEAEE